MPHTLTLRALSLTPRALSGAVSMALLVMLGPSAPATGADNSLDGAAHGPLDGMRFVGTFGPKGEPADSDDVIYFADGHFWSKNCVPCGFAPGPYWVRYAEDGIHFRGQLSSPESGRFSYDGVVEGDRLEVTINWQKDRWYWSIDRDFWFEGSLAPRQAANSAPSVARIATAAASEARACEP